MKTRIIVAARSLALALPCFVPGVSFAADEPVGTEVVVTATRIETPRREIASSVTVVTADEIERKQQKSVSEVLRAVPGVDVVQSGGAGGNTVVFLRGANSEHTLVLIDGVEANNPITPNRAYNFADLSTENIERIEIVRGAQSTLYGSDALGGVINIITKKGGGDFAGTASAEAGAYNTYNEEVSLRGGGESSDYSLAASRRDSGSISAADARDGNTEHDRYGASTFSGRLGTNLHEQLDLGATIRYETARSDIDNSGGVGGDDPNRIFMNDQLFTRGQATTRFFGGALEQTWGVGFTDQHFEDNNDPDSAHPNDRLRSDYDGSRLKFDVQNNIAVADELGLFVGLETYDERGSSSYRSLSDYGAYDTSLSGKSARSSGAYGEASAALGGDFFSTFGIRIDDHEEFGSEVTWRIAPTYTVNTTGTRFAATVGTGYKAPSLFQLYSEYGSADLEPEESLSLDATIEQTISSVGTVSVTWYRNDFDNLITFDPDTYYFANIASATTQGVETALRSDLSDTVSAGVTYTYLDSKDDSTGEALLRRARHKASGELTVHPLERLSTTLSAVFTGVRDDNDFSTYPATRTTLSSCVLVNVAARYQWSEDVTVFARVDNLFDREYQDVLGYGTLGAAGYGGVKVVF